MTALAILAVNCGSSSLKFALYLEQGGSQGLQRQLLSGEFNGLQPGGALQLRWQDPAGTHSLTEFELSPAQQSDAEARFEAALKCLQNLLQSWSAEFQLHAVAHRVVHGGQRFTSAVRVDAEILQELASLNHLAPLHQPHNLAGIHAFARQYPDLPQVACFDTAFHSQIPDYESRFALPLSLREQGIRRYGFHGLSYQYIAGQLQQLSSRAAGRVIMLHLGSGASACAMLNGVSQASSMGFSALDGLIMGSRCGYLDPGVILHLLYKGYQTKQIEQLLYKESGLLGLSGIAADMRSLRASRSEAAQQAIEQFTYRIVREIGSLAAVLQGVDVLVFTGGIGEHDAQLRADVCAALAWLGLRLDAQKNQAQAEQQNAMALHQTDSSMEIWAIPTDEGRIAAQQALGLL